MIDFKTKVRRAIKRYWDEALVYACSLVGVYYALLKLAELDGGKFHPSEMAIIGAVFVSVGVTWLIESRGIRWGKLGGDVDASLGGRRKNLVPRLVVAFVFGAIGQIALPQVIDAGVKMVLGFFTGIGSGQV